MGHRLHDLNKDREKTRGPPTLPPTLNGVHGGTGDRGDESKSRLPHLGPLRHSEGRVGSLTGRRTVPSPIFPGATLPGPPRARRVSHRQVNAKDADRSSRPNICPSVREVLLLPRWGPKLYKNSFQYVGKGVVTYSDSYSVSHRDTRTVGGTP